MSRPFHLDAAAAVDWTADHPEWWALGLSVVAWAGLVTSAGQPAWSGVCEASDAIGQGVWAELQSGWARGDIGAMVVGWAGMSVAMVPLLAAPLLRHVAERSYAGRRDRAMTGFLGGVLAVWWLGGGLAAVAMLLPQMLGLPGRLAAVLGFAAAAIWQIGPAKRRALLRCHRTFPLAAEGWRADQDCVRRGVAHGWFCLMSCGPMMLAAMLAPNGLPAMVVTQVIALVERRRRQPRLERLAWVLGVCGLMIGLGLPL